MGAPSVKTTRRWIRRSRDEWCDLLARFEHSGQTREQFCIEQGVSLSSLSRWRQLLRDAGSRGPAAGEALFVELTPDAEASRTPGWDVELQLGAGVLLRVRRSC